MRYFISMLLALMPALAFAEVPHTFSPGDTVSSEKMNENFQALSDAEGIQSIIVTTRSDGFSHFADSEYVSEVATVTCNIDEQLVGGTCSCSHSDFDSATTNFGVSNFCGIAGNSVIGSCAAEAITLETWLHGPPITVYARCMATETGAQTLATRQAGTPQELSKEAQEMLFRLEQEMFEFSQAVQ